MSIKHAAGTALDQLVRQVILQRHRQFIVHIDLDTEQQAPSDLQDRYLFHHSASGRPSRSAADDLTRALQRQRERVRHPRFRDDIEL
jgi:hypothetical protein